MSGRPAPDDELSLAEYAAALAFGAGVAASLLWLVWTRWLHARFWSAGSAL